MKIEKIKKKRLDENKKGQFVIDKYRKGHVAQWIELLSHSGEDVGSKLLRKSRHAHEHSKENKREKKEKIKNIKEKMAYSLDKTTLSLRGISHEFESVVESNQNSQHNIYNDNNYINLSITIGVKNEEIINELLRKEIEKKR